MDNYAGLDGRIVKMEVDYTSACDEKIPMCQELAKKDGKFHEAIEILLQLEKQARLVSLMILLFDYNSKIFMNFPFRVLISIRILVFLLQLYKFAITVKIGML